MASNGFGTLFRITTWGESHGRAIGVVIDGCPAGLALSEEEVQAELDLRRPGRSAYTTPRKETDHAEIVSGVFEGKTTGAPIAILLRNEDGDASKYTPIQELLRPGHANFTYLEKYGVFDYRGGGRASARETACRVAAGAVAKKLLAQYGIQIVAYTSEIGGVGLEKPPAEDLEALRAAARASALFCPEPKSEARMRAALEAAKKEGDSLGGIVSLVTSPLPSGLGDPVYEKLEANLAKAMLSIPATKGFEIGEGFAAARMKGSQHNDRFCLDTGGRVVTESNCAGGTLGGISTGMPLFLRVAFKPTSSIQKSQHTLTTSGKSCSFALPAGSRHDPCVALRAVPVVEAMAALVLADALLCNRCARLYQEALPECSQVLPESIL